MRLLGQTQKEQIATQSALGSFPRYRAVSSEVISLADLQKTLRPGEAYYRMTNVGDFLYAMLISPTSARAVKLDSTASQLGEQVDALRETISTVENGQRTTYPFDVALSHQIYGELFGPFDGELGAVKHLIFEPDGAMLRLPAEPAGYRPGLGRHRTRSARPPAATPNFDFRGISWFGRDRDISTAVSARASFAQLRGAPPSAGHEGISRPRRKHAADSRGGSDGSGGGRPRLHPADVLMGASDLGA